MVGYFCLIWAFFNIKNKKEFFRLSSMAVLIPVSALIITLMIVRNIDTYYPTRSTTANGFFFQDWQMYFDALHATHPFLSIPSIFTTRLKLHYESIAYVGAFALYGFLFFLVFWLLKKFSKKHFNVYFKKTIAGGFIQIFMITGIGLLFIALGSNAHFFEGKVKFDNWLNPLYFLVQFFEEVTQFRCMGRFNWVFFLSIQFLILYLLDQFYLRNKAKKWAVFPIIILPFLMIVDTFDMVRWHHQTDYHVNPLIQIEPLDQLEKLSEGIDMANYQAFLPIPYFHSSCEDYNYTIDGEDRWIITTFQFSQNSGLPSMASKMGRTPLAQTHVLFDIFLKKEISPLIKKNLDNRPILVFYNKNKIAWEILPQREPAKTAFENSVDFPQRKNLTLLSELGDWQLYEWNWKIEN